METWLRSFCISVSTYSAIPMPQLGWDKKSMAYSFCFLPMVGVAIGLLEWGWLSLCWLLGFNLLFKSAVAAFIPLLVSGGIHMDGFCDTMDAFCARQGREKSLEIMKDSHSGAFAIIFCGAYLMLMLGVTSETCGNVGVFCTAFVLSRAVSVPSVSGKLNARGEGMLASLVTPLHVRTVKAWGWGWIVLCAVFMDICDVYAGTGALAAAVVTWFAYHAAVFSRFGGITGDTSGFFVQLLELTILFGAALGQGIEVLLYKF